MSRPRLIALLLAFTTLLVFLPVGWHDFVNYDDTDYVTDNSFVKNGLTATDIGWAFTTFHAANWHPLTWLSHQADCELFGLNPGAQHLVNVLFHAANVVLLFLLLLRLTDKIWPSALVAALFAWHPLHVESVAWIAERKDVLSTFFALLSLLAYARYVQAKGEAEGALREADKKPAPASNQPRASRNAFWLALIFFTLGLLAKPMLVTLPFVMLLLDFWPLQRLTLDAGQEAKIRRLLAEKIPFFILAAISCVITIFAQKSGEAVVSLIHVPLLYRLENAPVAIASYLWKFIWPTDLCVIYPQEAISAWQIILSLAVLLFISARAWRCRKTKPYFLFGWLWFLGTLVPVIGIVQVGSQALADRYTYIPSIGLLIALVFLARDAAAHIQTPPIIRVGVATLILLAGFGVTEFQLQFWRDSETLFRRAIAETQHNTIAFINLGVALEAEQRPDEALAAYLQAEKFETAPYYQLHDNLGHLLSNLGRHADALAEYQTAVGLRPNDPYPHNAVGSEWAALEKFDAALKEFSAAEKLNPYYAWPHIETAKVFFKQGRALDAVSELHRAAELDPNNFQILATVAHYLAANENTLARDGQSALALATKADALTEHTQPMVLDVLGMAYAATGDFTNAQTCAQNAIDLGTAAGMKNLEPFRQRLALYQQNQPWRESFGAANAPLTPILKN